MDKLANTWGGRRDLIEAFCLSVAAHLVFVLFLFVARPQIVSSSMKGDLYYRIDEPQADTPLIDPARGNFTSVSFTPKIASAPPAPQDFEREDPWMNQMPSSAVRMHPTRELEVMGNGATSALDQEALETWRERRSSVQMRTHRLMRHFQSAALTPLAELDRDQSLSSFQYYCKLPSPSPEKMGDKGRVRGGAAQSPQSGEKGAKGVRETLTWLRGDAPTQRAPGLALQAMAPNGITWGASAHLMDNECAQLATCENFDIDVCVHRRFNGQGVLFEAKFRPKAEVAFREIRQNYLFLIDRSSSINHQRFAQYKEAVLTALDHLQPSNTFNVLFFDKRVAKWAPSSLPGTQENLDAARAFIKGEKSGGFFSSTDLYSSLERIIPQAVADDEVVTAILLSDGDSRLSRERERRTIASFCEKNHNKVSLFALACGENNNLPLLELLTFFNRGRLSYCREGKKLPEHLRSLVNSLRFPIGKEMLASAIDLRGIPTPHLLPKSGQQTNLHRGLAHTVIGSCAHPEAFYLFLQGRHCGNWLDMKFRVSADHIEAPDPDLERRYIVMCAFDHYANYLQSGAVDQLNAARELLSSLGYFAAFR